MSDIHRILSALALTLLACGPAVVSDEMKFLVVRAPEGGLTTSLPARVSLFFTVQTSTGAPVAGLAADAFRITEDLEPVSPLESQQKIQPRGQAYRMDSLLLLDMSGSMLRSGTFPKLREAAGRYVTEVLSQGAGQQIALMTFDGRAQPTLVSGFTSDATALQHALDGLLEVECHAQADCAAYTDRRTCAAFRCVDDSTNLNGALMAGVDLLEGRLQAMDGVQYKDAALVAFTDGRDQAARVSEDVARDRISRSSVKVLTVALGTEVDGAALAVFGKNGAFSASSPEQLDAAFLEAATKVMGEANQSYVLEYCSPRRGGQHKLKVTVSSARDGDVLEGSFSGGFDATGFTSGCAL